jgi:hypothetical protein
MHIIIRIIVALALTALCNFPRLQNANAQQWFVWLFFSIAFFTLFMWFSSNHFLQLVKNTFKKSEQ